MFSVETYVQRRKILRDRMKSGLIILMGNQESHRNYPANCYSFRQDSTFLYYFGLDSPGVAGAIDLDADTEVLYGDDPNADDLIWTGPHQAFARKAELAGVKKTARYKKLGAMVKAAIGQGRKLHWLPQYRHDSLLELVCMTGKDSIAVQRGVSGELVRAVAAQRSVKSRDEIAQIEAAIDISSSMYGLAFRLARPGIFEYEVCGAIEGLAAAKGVAQAFPIILSVRGEVLHGCAHDNRMKSGDLLLVDSGVESSEHYASDITRVLPVGGSFTPLQRDIYSVVLAANQAAIAAMRPDVLFRDVHLKAAAVIAAGMQRLGFMKGNVDNAVEAGAHSLFFPHGLGHLLGLDAHDLEGLGEDVVGYGGEVKRSRQFGLAHLRFAKKLDPGMVLTVEPGIYFMPSLIAAWRARKKCAEFIDYAAVEKALDFGGIRLEDDVLVTQNGCRVLGTPIPKSIEEIESACK